MSSSPKITVLMPVYNCELYVKEAVDSILNQTFSDFEFIIIDDASTDSTVSIIKSYNDPRIQLIEKPQNSGYTNSLNNGLSIAKGEYIARMDGDDISLPERFAKQVTFLDANPDVVLCGTVFTIIGTDIIVTVPENNENIKLAMLKDCCIGHPTVMIRKNILDKFSLMYDATKEPAEDYDLWTRMLVIGKLHNLQEVLLQYRIHNSQVSQKRNEQQTNIALEIKTNLINNLNLNKDEFTTDLLKKIISGKHQIYFSEIEQFQDLKSRLLLANEASFFEKTGFEKYLLNLQNNLYKDYFLKRKKYSASIFFQYLKARNKRHFKLIARHEIKLFIKSMIFYTKKNE
ncbi:glycosyltransferase family 2 protein [Flavobacterium aquidurense]|uniref:Sugar transferase n=1 Tax=Flavobacterium aquidurense TaxID=362413 RepID=A0A0Q0S7M5_9FLAO|nr:glycosyltransferase [Flavobacterium aquidurense]KQB41565.1 Sugar transferase [Flavobacterium aquidurense]